MNITQCLNCGSEKILPDIPFRGGASGRGYSIQINEEPEALIFKRSHYPELQGALCVECGFLHTFVCGDLDVIQAVYEKRMARLSGVTGEGNDLQAILRLLNVLAHSADMTERQRAVTDLENMGWTPENEHEKMLYRMAQEPIESVWFGTPVPCQRRLCNPEFSDVTVPLYFLRQIIIDTETYDPYCLERFLTYFVSTLGQHDMKHHVTAHINGEPEKLHHNLRNSLTSLCKQVSIHEKNVNEGGNEHA